MNNIFTNVGLNLVSKIENTFTTLGGFYFLRLLDTLKKCSNLLNTISHNITFKVNMAKSNLSP